MNTTAAKLEEAKRGLQLAKENLARIDARAGDLQRLQKDEAAKRAAVAMELSGGAEGDFSGLNRAAVERVAALDAFRDARAQVLDQKRGLEDLIKRLEDLAQAERRMAEVPELLALAETTQVAADQVATGLGKLERSGFKIDRAFVDAVIGRWVAAIVSKLANGPPVVIDHEHGQVTLPANQIFWPQPVNGGRRASDFVEERVASQRREKLRYCELMVRQVETGPAADGGMEEQLEARLKRIRVLKGCTLRIGGDRVQARVDQVLEVPPEQAHELITAGLAIDERIANEAAAIATALEAEADAKLSAELDQPDAVPA